MRSRASRPLSPCASSRYLAISSLDSTARVISSSIAKARTIALEALTNRLREFHCPDGAAEISRSHSGGKHGTKRGQDAFGHGWLVDVMQHEYRRVQQGHRVGEPLPGNIGRAAVNGLEDPDVGTQIRAGDDAEAADEAGTEVRHDVAIQIRQQQYIELRGVHDQMHARGVDDALVAADVRILRSHALRRT